MVAVLAALLHRFAVGWVVVFESFLATTCKEAAVAVDRFVWAATGRSHCRSCCTVVEEVVDVPEIILVC